jgi:ribosomal protein S12
MQFKPGLVLHTCNPSTKKKKKKKKKKNPCSLVSFFKVVDKKGVVIKEISATKKKPNMWKW